MNVFQLSCCHLFKQHPLYKYRTLSSEHSYDLKVLLIGSGSRMDTLFQKVLTLGQLLDTHLQVSIFTSNPKRAVTALIKKSPELNKHAAIFSDCQPMNTCCHSPYATIQYFSLPTNPNPAVEIHARCRDHQYLIISTGKEEENLRLALQCSQHFPGNVPIAFVQSKPSPHPLPGENNALLYPFGFQKETTSLKKLEQIGFNLHYAYCKSQNDRMDSKTILSTFQEDYNYLSNIENAMHIQSKLACCGIDTGDLSQDADFFHQLILEQPAIVNTLAALEHRRWMMEKILKGYSQLQDYNLIYSSPGTTTHSNTDKWHVCLLPCDETSFLTDSDWSIPAESLPSTLDELDRLSVTIHQKCRELAEKNRPYIEELLSAIRNTIVQSCPQNREILSVEQELEFAISQMWQKKRSAISIYEKNFSYLQNILKENAATSFYFLHQSLTTLSTSLAPLKEYISFKDYKEQDRILVRQIPYALTHKRQPILIKLLADRELDNLYSIYQLEPDKILFFDVIENEASLYQIQEHILHISGFLNRTFPAIEQEYILVTTSDFADFCAEELSNFEELPISLCAPENLTLPSTEELMKDILSEEDIDYMDITGGHPLLTLAAHDLDIPVIAFTRGKFRNISHASEIAYPAPQKNISVEEMFAVSGTSLIEKSDSSKMSDLSQKYKEFMEIALQAPDWAAFCTYVSEYYKNHGLSQKTITPKAATSNPSWAEKYVTLKSETANAFLPMIIELERLGYVQNISVTQELQGQRTISFSTYDNDFANRFLSEIKECIRDFHPDYSYHIKKTGKELLLQIGSNQIQKITFPNNLLQSAQKIIGGLVRHKLLTNYIFDQHKRLFSFQFSSADMLSAIQVSGKVLEYYLYYSALLDAHFDDVEMGWHFKHSQELNSPDNELDIICTKGLASYFISAKMIELEKKDKNHLNYILYEISQMAYQFGINATPILAIPEVPQFQQNPNTGKWELSNYVQKAFHRGVYLIGTECFSQHAVGQVLDNIAAKKDNWCQFLMP